MNLLTAPALALRCLQFKISTYHGSQLTEHEICRKHYRELEKRNRTCFSPFHDEATENKQQPQKYPKFIWEKLDDIVSFDKYTESHSPGKNWRTLLKKGNAVLVKQKFFSMTLPGKKLQKLNS